MPLYDWRCESCGKVEEHYARMSVQARVHESCGGTMRRMVTSRYCIGGKEQDYIEENLGHEPVRIRNSKQLDQEMRKRGLYARTHPKHRWW